ncbi:hypothetical protein LPE509_01949 [Legionella pneumophila subsp. pneumophila LPE509]|nr:hypothetical protein LPE509_01949 [Legionella pneumophila subsp. pneumophila LPE509]
MLHFLIFWILAQCLLCLNRFFYHFYVSVRFEDKYEAI